MKKTSKLLAGCLVLLAFSWLLSSCGSRRVVTTPAKVKVGTPAKVPSSGAIPATQRPYRINGRTYYPLPSCDGYQETGIASWYGGKFHGRLTSNGETYDMDGPTAAHKTLPMNTMVLVKNLENRKESVVRINDRGPFVKGRIIDLSRKTARDLDLIGKGTGRVQVTALGEAATYQVGHERVERFLPHQDFRHGDFYVQIGSFLQRDNAERLRNRMTARGRKTVIQPYQHDGSNFYRVQVQASKDLARARQLEKALSEAGFPGAFVIAR